MNEAIKQKTLTEMLGVIYTTAERRNLDPKKVNEIVRKTQDAFRKDFKQTELRCFVCENE